MQGSAAELGNDSFGPIRADGCNRNVPNAKFLSSLSTLRRGAEPATDRDRLQKVHLRMTGEGRNGKVAGPTHGRIGQKKHDPAVADSVGIGERPGDRDLNDGGSLRL